MSSASSREKPADSKPGSGAEPATLSVTAQLCPTPGALIIICMIPIMDGNLRRLSLSSPLRCQSIGS